MKQQEIQQLINEQESIILDRKSKLRGYDYIGVKIAMGVASKEDYRLEIIKTEEWRAQIGAAQAEIERLKAIEPEPEQEGGEV